MRIEHWELSIGQILRASYNARSNHALGK
jgi:hypothetical protein